MILAKVEIYSDRLSVHCAKILIDGKPINQVVPNTRRFTLDLEAGDLITGHIEFIVDQLNVDANIDLPQLDGLPQEA